MPVVLSRLPPAVRAVCRAVLWAEIVINVANGAVSIVDPELSLRGMTTADLGAAGAAAPLEAARWFGALSATFGGFVLWRALDTAALRIVLEGLLVGDVLYLASFAPFAARFGALPLVVAPFALTAVMFAARLALLLSEDWAAAAARDAAGAAAGAAAAAAASAGGSAPLLAAAAPEGDGGSEPAVAPTKGRRRSVRG